MVIEVVCKKRLGGKLDKSTFVEIQGQILCGILDRNGEVLFY